MSNIKVQGDVSGTGTFTIAAPNGNTDRTLTLPDETGTVLINGTTNNVGIGTSSPADILHISKAGDLYLRVANTSTGINAYLGQDSNGTYIGNTGASVVRFIQGGAERMRIDSSGNLLVGTTSATCGSVDMKHHISASDFCLGLTATGGGASRQVARFSYSTTAVGSIVVGSSSTSYNTSSDYRLKHDVQPITGALTKISALKPCTYKWNSDGSNGEGFIAHELQAVVPQCVTGEKDAVDANGNPVYQGIDTSFLVATLTAAIQEQQAIIEQLKADVAELKGAV